MTAVAQYVPQTDFSEDEADLVSGRSTVRTPELDAELAAIAVSITGLITKASAVLRDDNTMLDGVVTVASLSSAVLALIGAGVYTVNAAGAPWLTATAYAKFNLVTQGTGTYIAAVAHTSGVFATDLAAGKWIRLFDSTAFAASGITFVPTGSVAAANVQAAIAEVDSEKLAKASNLTDVASTVVALANLGGISTQTVQNGGAIYSAGSGSASALRGAFTPPIIGLVDGMVLVVEAVGVNVGTAPNFTPNFGVIPERDIKKQNALDLGLGDIAGVGHRLILTYHASGSYWELLNPATQGIPGAIGTAQGDLVTYTESAKPVRKAVGAQGYVLQPSSGSPDGLAWAAPGAAMLNGYITASVAANAMTIELKTLADANPSDADPVFAVFRSATLGSGGCVIRKITGALSLVISSGSTLGTVSATPSRVWIGLQDDASAIGLVAICTQLADGIFPLADSSVITSVTEGGAGAADSAGVYYATAGAANLPFRVIGYVESTQATAGTWATAPSKIQNWSPAMKLPGDLVQTRQTIATSQASGTGTFTFSDAIPQNTDGDNYINKAITPTSPINLLEIDMQGNFSTTSTGLHLAMWLIQDTTANALSTTAALGDQTASSALRSLRILHRMRAGTTSSTNFAMRAGCSAAGTCQFNGRAGARYFGGTYNSYIYVREYMA